MTPDELLRAKAEVLERAIVLRDWWRRLDDLERGQLWQQFPEIAESVFELANAVDVMEGVKPKAET